MRPTSSAAIARPHSPATTPKGLVFVIRSGEVVAVTALSATIRTNGGATLTFRRTPPAPGQHAVATWELCVEPVEVSGV
jgi:hypothetical protein